MATGSSIGWWGSGATRFAVVGLPWLDSVDEIAGCASTWRCRCALTASCAQHSSAGEMIFTVPEAIAWISQFVTLEPGDLICMGTPGGVGETTQTYLQPGDEVEATIEGLGTSINPVRRCTSPIVRRGWGAPLEANSAKVVEKGRLADKRRIRVTCVGLNIGWQTTSVRSGNRVNDRRIGEMLQRMSSAMLLRSYSFLGHARRGGTHHFVS